MLDHALRPRACARTRFVQLEHVSDTANIPKLYMPEVLELMASSPLMETGRTSLMPLS
jgi:hypothetical protein